MDIGMMGYGLYVPEPRMTSAEIASATNIPENVISQKFGIKQKPVPGPHDTTAEMGLIAARRAIESAGIDPMEIDLVVWFGAQHKDYPCWLASLKIAHELGAGNAWGFDMEAMCGSFMVALETARGLMLSSESNRTVLLVSGYRNADLINLTVPETTFMADLSAGGAAAVLRRGYDRNVLLGTAFKGDGSFSELCVVPVLGSKKWPPEPGDDQKAFFRIDDPEEFKRKLGEKTMPNFYWVVREALRRSGGLTEKDVDYLAILHFKKSAHDAVLAELGLSPDQTTYLDDYGHMGQNDQLLSLDLGLKAGKVKDGDIVSMVGAGLGFVWASAVMRWGRQS